jgi:hypothetical protein
MDPYKNIWRKTQQELQTELGKSPRATNVSMVAARIKRGNQQGAVNKLREIISRASGAAALAGSNAVSGNTPTSSARLNEYFKSAKANLTRRFASTGRRPSAALIQKVAALRRKGTNNTAVLNAIEKKVAQVMAVSAAKAAQQAAKDASAKANEIKAAAEKVANAPTPEAAVSNLKNVLAIAGNKNRGSPHSRKTRKNRKN